ncbi:MAG: S49 family peptidase, partial [Candidatus Nanohaloarchaea archaeon]
MFERLTWHHLFILLALLATVSFLISPAATDLRRDLSPRRGEVAVIHLSGPISFGNGLQEKGISPGTIADLTSRAVREGADAVIYRINSGGGGAVASRQAARIVDDAKVPTVCRITEVGASGAYWMASACDRIVADHISLMGSIGVKSSYLEISGLLQRFGVEYVNLTSAEYKDMGSRFTNLSREERRKFGDILNASHRYFVRDIAENRNLSGEAVARVATGEIFLGET